MRYREIMLTEAKLARMPFEITDPESITSIDQPDAYYYHVTTRPRAVLRSGLRPNQAPSMDAGFYRTYSAGKVFFCERPGVPYWLWRIGDHLEARFEVPPKLSVVRFPKTLIGDPEIDQLGTNDSREKSYFVSHPVPAKSVEQPLHEEQEDDDDDDTQYDHLPSIKLVQALKPRIAAAAQKVYDAWVQDDDDELNGGGICHLIADEAASLIGNAGVPVATQCASDEQHVYCICQCLEGIFEVDIPYRTYERGAGFTWTKLPDVQFTPDDVVISGLDADPGRMGLYVEEWES